MRTKERTGKVNRNEREYAFLIRESTIGEKQTDLKYLLCKGPNEEKQDWWSQRKTTSGRKRMSPALL